MTTLELHDRSITLGNKFAEVYAATSNVDEQDLALDAYIAARRALKRDGYTGRRYGASEAYQATQGFNLDS